MYGSYQILHLSANQFLIKKVSKIETFQNETEIYYSKDSNYVITLICTIDNQINLGYIKSPLGKMIKFKETFLHIKNIETIITFTQFFIYIIRIKMILYIL